MRTLIAILTALMLVAAPVVAGDALDARSKGYAAYVVRDYAKAAHWIRIAARMGDARAQESLGHYYEFGVGLPKDYAQAFHWYHMAAKQGYQQAHVNLGTMYARGKGVSENNVRAYAWYRRASHAWCGVRHRPGRS